MWLFNCFVSAFTASAVTARIASRWYHRSSWRQNLRRRMLDNYFLCIINRWYHLIIYLLRVIKFVASATAIAFIASLPPPF
jgi:hypothetical protein